MHKIASIFAVSALALMLAACGGSNDAFVGSASGSGSCTSTSSSSSSSASGPTTPGGSSSSCSSSSSSSPVSTVSKITLITSSPQIQSDNSGPVTITAIVTNSNNAVVTGAGVIFSASSGTIAPVATSGSNSAGTSDSNGEASATLSTPGDPSNRSITVTATVGTVSASLSVAVVGTKLSVSGPSSLINGSSGTFSVALTNSSGGGIPNQSVALTSANGNTLSSASVTTDASGHATFTLTGKTAGADTVSAAALGLTATQAVNVSGQSFNITTPTANANIDINTPQTVTVVWNNNGAPVAGQTVTFNTSRGQFSGGGASATATTDSSGTATASLSSATAGPVVITASASGVSTQTSAAFIATMPASIDVQASPATIPTNGQSTITAIVWDPNNNLVEGQTVDFQLTDKTGGTISVASAVTDSQGRAQTVYAATSTPSASNGVSVTATVQGTAITGSATLTVGGQSVFLSMGTGNTIVQLPNGCSPCTQFGVPFTVQALDSSGHALTGVTISLTVHSFPQADVPQPPALNADGSTSFAYAAYAKGNWVTVGSAAASSCNGGSGPKWCQILAATCYNEDVDGSGILNPNSNPPEDINGNGRLDPGDVASVSPGSVTTDATGTGSFTVVYPQDHALWVQVVLTATATVSGTQATTSTIFWLPILADDLNQASSPPGYLSPYGTANACNLPN